VRSLHAKSTEVVFCFREDFTYGHAMRQKVTIARDEAVHDGLNTLVERGNTSKFIEDLVRPHVLGGQLDAGYRAMAADAAREDEAREWIDELAGDSADEAR